MTRPLRILYLGALYHVTSRGNAGGTIYKDDYDRKKFLEISTKGIINKKRDLKFQIPF